MNEVNSIPVVSLRIKEDSKLYAEEPISNAEDAVKIFTKAIDLSKIRDEAMAEEVLDIER